MLKGKRVVLMLACVLSVSCSDSDSPRAPQSPDSVQAQALITDKSARQLEAFGGLGLPANQRQILFGDLHVHTTLSPDAFITAMPLMNGDGLHPPADACDFARFCSALDFWSINDHAEGITPARWQQTRDAIRQCNAASGDPSNPDTVAFLGWEWSQINNREKDKHYGHKNVMFVDTDDDKVPTRSIAAPREKLGTAPFGKAMQLMLSVMDWSYRDYYFSFSDYYQEIADTPVCEKGINTRDLPDDCLETADDPEELFRKLDEWGYDSIVIPHGNAWGLNTPAATTFDKQLNRQQHDPKRQTLFEVYSGHGNSEEYRDWRAVDYDSAGVAHCPQSSDNYQPCCQRAGDIIYQRCISSGETDEECSSRQLQAQDNYIAAGVSGHLTVPGASTEDWLNCGQCEDCFNPGMDHRPGTTAQYALAITNFDQPEDPFRFEFGFIGSSDNHRSRGGSGYKEFARYAMTESYGMKSERLANATGGAQSEPLPYSVTLEEVGDVNLNNLRNMERQGSFFMTGGLVAVHSEGRAREQIWGALKNRQVYGTSGDRILLWFDLLTDQGDVPMGSIVSSASNPVFRVSAAGAFEQLPGCPSAAVDSLTPDRIESLCRGECYHPSSERKRIERIEVVRIRPQNTPGEDIGELIEDPWRVFECPDDPNGCTVEFEDSEFVGEQREVRYYVRAIQQASDAINAGGLRCEYDDKGQCIAVNPCFGDYRSDPSDDCLAPNKERAWSSPIYLKFENSAAKTTNNEL